MARFDTYRLLEPNGNPASERLDGIEQVKEIFSGNYVVRGNPPHYCPLKKGQHVIYTEDSETKSKMRPLFDRLGIITGEMAFDSLFDIEIMVFSPPWETLDYVNILALMGELY